MAAIQTIPLGQATGTLKELYEADLKNLGYVPNYAQALSIRPEVYAAWKNLIGTIRSKMRLRRYELVTFSSALALRCSY